MIYLLDSRTIIFCMLSLFFSVCMYLLIDLAASGLSWGTRGLLLWLMDFRGGSAGEESACNAGDLGLIPGWEDPLEKGKVTHSGTLAWRIPWTGSPWGWQRARHDWAIRSHLLGLSSLVSRLSCSVMRRVLVPQPGIEPASPALQGRFLATAPPGEVPCMLFLSPEFLLCVCIMKTFLCRNVYFLIIIVTYYFPIFIPLIYLSFILSLTGIATEILNSSSQNSHSYPLTIFNINNS